MNSALDSLTMKNGKLMHKRARQSEPMGKVYFNSAQKTGVILNQSFRERSHSSVGSTLFTVHWRQQRGPSKKKTKHRQVQKKRLKPSRENEEVPDIKA